MALRSKNEMVRAEILGVISYAVDQCARSASLQAMRILLAGSDEEATFPNNVIFAEAERVYVRTLATILESFYFPMDQAAPQEAPEASPEDAGRPLFK
ncbi:hypothetical protein BDN71DRAFT_1502980 [Pleurotus eryngii]|uniref:Uncharacterized protein n=1 Tax=Pleurotus eryngii TaxID=5323 RepID=A0A9P6DJQ0_PLEER|nr:hypothetical protein BDN71DRAFT_1502980 [Pleurotus eryngii]